MFICLFNPLASYVEIKHMARRRNAQSASIKHGKIQLSVVTSDSPVTLKTGQVVQVVVLVAAAAENFQRHCRGEWIRRGELNSRDPKTSSHQTLPSLKGRQLDGYSSIAV